MKKEDTIHPLKLPAGEPQTVDCVDYGFLAVEIPRRIVKAYAKILKFRIFSQLIIKKSAKLPLRRKIIAIFAESKVKVILRATLLKVHCL